jgi:hypothetical protein
LSRLSVGANTTGQSVIEIAIRVPVKAFQSIYVHCTGAGNLGTYVLS